MSEQHPLDPPPSNLVGVQNVYTAQQWEKDSERVIKREMLDFLYGRLAAQKRIPVGIVEAGWYRHDIDGQPHVTIRMRVPTAELLMDVGEILVEES